MTGQKLVAVAQQAIDELEEKQKNPELYRPVKFNIPELDRIVGGVIQPSYVVIGGSAKVGKTAFAVHTANVIASVGRGSVKYYSLEELRKQVAVRSLTRLTTVVNRTNIRDLTLTSEHFVELRRAVEGLKNVDMWLEDSIYNADAIIKDMKETGIQIGVIDYLQLMEGGHPGQKENERFDTISRMFVQARNKYNLTFIVIYQLNDEGKAFGTRSVYKDADLILQVVPMYDNDDEIIPGKLYIEVLPSRQAEGNAKVEVAFSGAHSRIKPMVNLEDIQAEMTI
jgi:replicative DNA helicase